ncbi:hypothetical protein SAMN05216174_102306 [Actinokineospora iranica]|uniref:Uncharacterized protein n=2 Tax=Actinokineospora iranica TaxID=1271860 RepID=A0A1G6LZL9_9PSEU|nr:hypothetical protein SAMN05216174_102306 [Actinokineospora iranica]
MGRKALLLAMAAVTAMGAATAASGSAAAQDTTAPPPGAVSQSQVIGTRQAPDGSTVTTVRLGPIKLAPHTDDGPGHGHPEGEFSPMHGPHEPMHGTHTRSLQMMLPPCVACFVNGIKPDLVYADGRQANYDTKAMLHHAVFFDRSRADVTCSGGWVALAGRRIFASGNERTGGTLPDGYGVALGVLPLTYAALELMNLDHHEQEVFLTVEFSHVPWFTPGMREVTPVWLDKDNCRLSEHSVPEGESHTNWKWTSTVKGTLKGAGGHLHDGGESVTLTNSTTGKVLCESRAAYNTIPSFMGHIESMSRCLGQDLGTIDKGDVLDMDSVYHTHYADDHAMTIMIAYVHEQR